MQNDGQYYISENIAVSFILKLRNKFKRDTLWHEAHWQFKNVLTPGIYKQAQLRGPTKHKILTCATRCLKYCIENIILDNIQHHIYNVNTM